MPGGVGRGHRHVAEVHTRQDDDDDEEDFFDENEEDEYIEAKEVDASKIRLRKPPKGSMIESLKGGQAAALQKCKKESLFLSR